MTDHQVVQTALWRALRSIRSSCRYVMVFVGCLVCGGLTAVFAGGGGGAFPSAGVDSFQSKGVFKITLSPPFGGTTHVIKVNDPATVIRSDPLTSGQPCSGPLGDSGAPCPGCTCTPDLDGTCDVEIGAKPSGFDGSSSVEEAHVELSCLTAEDSGWTIRIGEAAPSASPTLGEVEARQAPPPQGFPADSFFNLFMEIQSPPSAPFGAQVLRNQSLLQVADLDGYSFGTDGGNVMLFSVQPVLLANRQSAISFGATTVGTIEATCGSGVCESFEDFASCPVDCATGSVPAASAWSLLIMALGTVTAGTLVFTRRLTGTRPCPGVGGSGQARQT